MYVLALSDKLQYTHTNQHRPETFKSQFNVSNSKKRALSFIQNNKARIIYICVC